MCVDYSDLNKHCQKDHFGLPRIDQVVNSTAGCVLLCFLDCYLGYHQIALKEEDQIKTAFITAFGTYAYKTMSFRLKNAGATYQRAIQMCFADPGLRDCVHNIVHTGIGDRTCPIPYLCCTLLSCKVELVDTEGSYSSCTRVRFLS
jgi:hypothetical protein